MKEITKETLNGNDYYLQRECSYGDDKHAFHGEKCVIRTTTKEEYEEYIASEELEQLEQELYYQEMGEKGMSEYI